MTLQIMTWYGNTLLPDTEQIFLAYLGSCNFLLSFKTVPTGTVERDSNFGIMVVNIRVSEYANTEHLNTQILNICRLFCTEHYRQTFLIICIWYL